MSHLSTLSGILLAMPGTAIARGIAIIVSSLTITFALVCAWRIRRRQEKLLDEEIARITRDDARSNHSGAL